MTICILGRQPALGLAELESLYGTNAVRPLGTQFAMVNDGIDVDITRLGGTVKIARHYETVDTVQLDKIFEFCRTRILESKNLPNEGKFRMGASMYGFNISPAKLNAHMLSLKKAITKSTPLSVRIIPNRELALNSAQTLHNKLATERGIEVLFIRDGNQTIIARIIGVQDIEAYRRRDQERPMRDTYVGMLPPKLAQTIINIATGPTPANEETVVLDPFCGTGVVLQEACLMGYGVYGTDVSDKMVRYTRDNLNWLREKTDAHGSVFYEVADATEHTWRQPIDIVACEGYLGHPFASAPQKEALMETVHTCNLIMRKFLQNIAGQLKPGTRLCIAAPAWFFRGQIQHLPVLDDLEKMGYTRIDFVHANREDLIYRRTDQVTGRELVVLTKE